MPNHDDAYRYEQLAKGCIAENTWYPGSHNMHDLFIFGPAHVNLLIVIHSLFDSFYPIRFINLILNILLVIEIFILARRIFNEKTAYLSAILYMLIYSNVFVPIAILTDLPYVFLSLTALLLCTEKKILPIVIAGVLIALANWFRPLAVVFLVTILFYFVIKKRKPVYYAALLFPLMLTVVLIGENAKSRTGHFIYQSVTGGVNLAMCCFDDANGLVNLSGFYDSTNYICLKPDTYTFIERDRLLKDASIKWIKENPKKYAVQLPVKLLALYCEDTWSERVKPDMGFRVVLSKAKEDRGFLTELIITLVLKSLVYYVILFFFFYYLWKNRRNLFRWKNVFLLIPLLGTAITLIFAITSRYHYPYLFMITIYAAAGYD